MTRHHDQHGFSLVEALIALGVVTVGVLGLAQVYLLGITHLQTSSSGLVAREKAREAIESIHAVRDSRHVTWDQMRNVNAPPSGCAGATSGGGIFLNGFQPLYRPGPDGLVNTANAAPQWDTAPGPDGRLGTADDVALINYRRDVRFCDVSVGLREVTVTIQYTVANHTLTYTLKSLIATWS